MTTTLQLQGQCDPRFSAVHNVFADNFAKRDDVGAAVCVYVDGHPVVDLWGGFADAARTQPWERNTIVSVASTTKGMVAQCAHMLVERGLLDLDAPVARYWPEFARAGKETLPVRWLLSHRAGLPAIRKDLTLQAGASGLILKLAVWSEQLHCKDLDAQIQISRPQFHHGAFRTGR